MVIVNLAFSQATNAWAMRQGWRDKLSGCRFCDSIMLRATSAVCEVNFRLHRDTPATSCTCHSKLISLSDSNMRILFEPANRRTIIWLRALPHLKIPSDGATYFPVYRHFSCRPWWGCFMGVESKRESEGWSSGKVNNDDSQMIGKLCIQAIQLPMSGHSIMPVAADWATSQKSRSKRWQWNPWRVERSLPTNDFEGGLTHLEKTSSWNPCTMHKMWHTHCWALIMGLSQINNMNIYDSYNFMWLFDAIWLFVHDIMMVFDKAHAFFGCTASCQMRNGSKWYMSWDFDCRLLVYQDGFIMFIYNPALFSEFSSKHDIWSAGATKRYSSAGIAEKPKYWKNPIQGGLNWQMNANEC